MRQSTPTVMLFGETGCAPIEIHIKSRVLNYWLRLCHPDYKDKVSNITYKFLYKLYLNNVYESPYITFVKKTLQDIGLHGIWLGQDDITFSPVWFKEKVKRGLLDNFIQDWYASVDHDSIYLNYRMFKTTFTQEKYIKLLPTNLAIKLAKFRTTNNLLPVNTLRFDNIPRNERKCEKCQMEEIGDEFHYIFICPYFAVKRRACLPKYFQRRPNAIKFNELFNSKKKTLLKLVHFVEFMLQELR